MYFNEKKYPTSKTTHKIIDIQFIHIFIRTHRQNDDDAAVIYLHDLFSRHHHDHQKIDFLNCFSTKTKCSLNVFNLFYPPKKHYHFCRIAFFHFKQHGI